MNEKQEILSRLLKEGNNRIKSLSENRGRISYLMPKVSFSFAGEKEFDVEGRFKEHAVIKSPFLCMEPEENTWQWSQAVGSSVKRMAEESFNAVDQRDEEMFIRFCSNKAVAGGDSNEHHFSNSLPSQLGPSDLDKWYQNLVQAGAGDVALLEWKSCPVFVLILSMSEMRQLITRHPEKVTKVQSENLVRGENEDLRKWLRLAGAIEGYLFQGFLLVIRNTMPRWEMGSLGWVNVPYWKFDGGMAVFNKDYTNAKYEDSIIWSPAVVSRHYSKESIDATNGMGEIVAEQDDRNPCGIRLVNHITLAYLPNQTSHGVVIRSSIGDPTLPTYE